MRNQEIWTWSELCLENNQRYWYMISAVVGIYYYTLQTIVCLHSHWIIAEECLCKEKIIMNDDAIVCNIQLALATNFVNFKAMQLNGFSIGNIWGIFEPPYLLHSSSYWSTFYSITSGI